MLFRSCHGALCMAVSGKCYLSLHEMNHSANRGACMQVCRRSYTVRDKETDVELDIDNEYIMSPKDLKTIHFMNKTLDAGVRVFKIEGRARGPEYVPALVSEATDAEFEEETLPDAPADLRTNLAETAFFYPQLRTNEQGEISFSFTMPESLTRWNFRGYAHTKGMLMGTLDGEAITSKEFMLTPNLPRFVREIGRAHV